MKSSLKLFFCVPLVLLSSCLKEKSEDIQYSSVSDIVAMATEGGTEFSLNIKDAVVSGASADMAVIQDGKTGAVIASSSHSLSAGTSITGQISGRAVKRGGCCFIEGYTGDVSSSEAQLPCDTLVIGQLTDQTKAAKACRRLYLKNVTFIKAISRSVPTGQISGRGVKESITTLIKNQTVSNGSQGDVICFWIDGELKIFDKTPLFKHDIVIPICEKTVYGLYGTKDDVVTDKYVYDQNAAQLCFFVDGDSVKFKIQDLDKSQTLEFIVTPAALFVGREFTLYTRAEGIAGYTPTESVVTLEKYEAGDRAWFSDYKNDLGFVILPAKK